MKSRIHLICVLLSFFMIQGTANAQILKKLKKRVQERTEDVLAEKAAQKAEQETEKVLDSLLDIDSEHQANNQKKLLDMMGAGSENIPVEESYSFDTMVVYEMTISNDAQESSVVNYEMWFPKEAVYMATKVDNVEGNDNRDMPSSVLSILDDKNQAMIIIMDAQKMAQIISMNKMKDIAETENEVELIDSEFQAIEKTGNSKKILGYNCQEFVAQNETSKILFWITEELSLFQKNMFFNISQSLGGNTFKNIPESAKGFMMEMHFEDQSSNERGVMKVKDIQKITKHILMSDYQVMNLSNFLQN